MDQQQQQQPGRIWTSHNDVTIANYYAFRDGFICPTCVIWESTTFDCFKATHSAHAGDFQVSKKKMFSRCTSTMTKRGDVWASEDDQAIASYYSFRNGFICPTCMTWEPITFVDFKVAHSHHAGNFGVSKATVFSNCSGSSSFYIWQRDETAQRRYYGYRGKFICPECCTVEENFEIFVEQHKHHAKAFHKHKSEYVPTINTVNDQQRRRPAMPSKRKAPQDLHFSRVTSDLNGSHRGVEITFSSTKVSLKDIVTQHRNDIIGKLDELDPTRKNKVQMSALCKFERTVGDEIEYKQWYISNCAVVPTGDFLDNGAQQLDEKIANYEAHGSNWQICDILKMGFVLAKHTDLCYLSGHSYIPTPSSLSISKAVVNVQNYHDSLFSLQYLGSMDV